MSQHAHRAWATRCSWQVRLVVEEAVAEASRELTVRGDLISDNEAGTGQAAVWLGSRRLAIGGEVDDFLLRLVVRDSGWTTRRVGREDDDLDAGQVTRSRSSSWAMPRSRAALSVFQNATSGSTSKK
jgi:hypothetical protein